MISCSTYDSQWLFALAYLFHLTLFRHAASVILRVVYGYDVKSDHDHYVALAHEAVVGLSQTINVGSYLVDFLPSLRYIPCKFIKTKLLNCGCLCMNSVVSRCDFQDAS